jgi:hypothetical protein
MLRGFTPGKTWAPFALSLLISCSITDRGTWDKHWEYLFHEITLFGFIPGRDFHEQNTAFQTVGLMTLVIHLTYLRIFQTEESSGHESGKK